MSDSEQSGPPTEAELTAQHTATVEQFVLRARRIEAHPLAQDDDALKRWAESGMGMLVRDGQTYLTFTAPPEELMESAAARVRPLLLNEDPVYVPTVMKALSYLVRDRTGLTRGLRDQRRQWEARVKKDGEPRDGYVIIREDAETGGSHSRTDRQLAYAWLYGDVVHHNLDARALGSQFGLDYRYRAAASMLAFLMRHAISTLNVIRDMWKAGWLPRLRDEVFEAPVVVTQTYWEYPAQGHVGDAGTALPDGLG